MLNINHHPLIVPLLLLLVLMLCPAPVLWAQDYQWTPQAANAFLEQTMVNPSPVLETEATTTYDAVPQESNIVPNRRQIESNDPFGGATIDDVDNPKEPGLPIGDVPVCFFLILSAVCILCTKRHLAK